MRTILTTLCCLVMIMTIVPDRVHAQSRAGDVIGTLSAGVNKYSGEFDDDLFGPGGWVSLQYAPISRLILEARLGLGEYRWKVTPSKIAAYPDYFGAGAQVGDVYPGTLTTIEPENESRLTTVDFLVNYVLVDGIAAVPFITAGVGLVNIAPSNSEEHSALPNNAAGVYPTSFVSIPLGGGLRIPLSRSVGLLMRAEYRLTFSSYLDDVDGGSNDALTSVGLGLTYRFNTPPRRPPSTCPVCGCRDERGCCCARRNVPPTPIRDTVVVQPSTPKPDTVVITPPAPQPDTVVRTAPAPKPDTVRIAPAKKRTSYAKDIRFKVNTDEFDFDQPETEKNLRELLTYMNESCDELQVMIEGHASADGPKDRNKQLSEMRAQRVRQWLLEQGVAPTKIRGAVGYGSAMPRVTEPSPAQMKKMTKDQIETIRRQNRRIEVSVLRECTV